MASTRESELFVVHLLREVRESVLVTWKRGGGIVGVILLFALVVWFFEGREVHWTNPPGVRDLLPTGTYRVDLLFLTVPVGVTLSGGLFGIWNMLGPVRRSIWLLPFVLTPAWASIIVTWEDGYRDWTFEHTILTLMAPLSITLVAGCVVLWILRQERTGAARDRKHRRLGTLERSGRTMGRVRCRCCGYPTLEANGSAQACTLCDWERKDAARMRGGREPNGGYTLRQARRNVRRYWTMYDLERPEPWMVPPTAEEVALKQELIQVFEEIRRKGDLDLEWWDRVLQIEAKLNQMRMSRSQA